MKLFEHLRSTVDAAGFLLVLAFLPALLSMGFATWSAVTTGEVAVYILGKASVSRELVPWPQAWARFASPVVLMVAMAASPGSENGSKLRQILFLALAYAGLLTLLSPLVFASWGMIFMALGIGVYMLLAHFVDAKWGRLATAVMLLGTIAVLLYIYMSTSA